MEPAAPSSLTTNLFAALCIAMVALWGGADSLADEVREPRPGFWPRVLLRACGLVAYIAGPLLLARWGVLDRWTMPPPALVMIGLVTATTVYLAFSPYGARFAGRIPLVWLVGFQVFRIPVELLLHRLYEEGVIPVQMTYSGLNFDIVAGITAGLVAIVLATGRKARGLVWAWNVLGLLLLGNIVVIAALSTPAPFRTFMNEPANRLIAMSPFVWLPTILVQAALFGHLVVFRALLAPAPATSPARSAA